MFTREAQMGMNAYESKQEARKQRLLDLADRMQAASDAAYQQARRMAEVIPMGQPILVGHHSEKRDRNYRARIWRTQDRCLELQKKAEYFRSKAAGVGEGGVSSDDPDGAAKLREQLAKAERMQVAMKAANKVYRSKMTDDEKVAAIVALGVPEKAARGGLSPDFCGRIGFPDYALTNNNANIRRLKERITKLDQIAAASSLPDKEYDCGAYTVVACFADNRVRVFFPGKPSEEIRTVLKRSGFRWSPDAGAWQRMLSVAVVHDLTREDGYTRRSILNASQQVAA